MSNPRNLSSFTLIVTFVCLSLIGVVLVPLLRLSWRRRVPCRSDCFFQYARQFVTGY